MALTRWNPWGDLFQLHDQVDRLFDEMLGRTTMPSRAEGVTHLPLDIRQTDEAFLIEASVPGFTPEDIEVTLDENVLTIRGERREEKEDGGKGGYVRRERRVSSVYRQVGLPAEVRGDDITANFENGVLTIRVPRAQKAQPKRIPVGSESKVIEAQATQPS